MRFCLVLGICIVAGCSNNVPETVIVRGRVTYQGKPVTSGTISFGPLSEDEGGAYHRPAISFIRPDGTYEMATFVKGDGVIPGKYAVWIYSVKDESSASADSRRAEWLVPKKYSQAKTSGLTIDVPGDARGANQHDFDLSD